MIDVHKYYDYMEHNNVLLLFKGSLNAELLSSIMQLTESKLDVLQEKRKVKKKIFNILVECLQNVYLHLDKMKNVNIISGDDSAIVIIGRTEKDYLIITGNYVENENCTKLMNNLDYLKTLDDDQLKEKYTEVLNNDQYSEQGGAGLGLIDMLRKSGRRVEYTVKPYDDEFSFFSVVVKISHDI